MSFIIQVNEIYAKMNSIITSIDAVTVLEPIQEEMVSIANDKATLDSLYSDKAKLDSLFADKAKLDSLFADKAVLDSLYSDKATLDGIFAKLSDIINVSGNMSAVVDAVNQANAAAASASAAATSEANAKTHEDNSSTSESNAKKSEINAANSAASVDATKILHTIGSDLANESYTKTQTDDALVLKENITDNDAKLALKENITDNNAKLALKENITDNNAKLALKVNISDISNYFSVDFKKQNIGVLFTKTSPSDFTIPVGFKVAVGSTTVEVSTAVTLSLNTSLDTGAKTAGTDYYVYAKSNSTFYISTDKTITTDRMIGGFHYGLVAEDEAATGNKTEADMVAIRGINQYSFWDLKFRPVANPEGMVHINGRWYDIYLLNSEHITNGTSKAGAVIAGGVADTTNYRAIPKIPLEFGGDGATNYGKFTWFQSCEIAKAHLKELISYSEFPTIAYGVSEQKSSQTDGYEVNIGKIEHYSNLTSKWGIEQATGTQWIWGKDVGGNRDEGSTAWDWRTGLTDNRGDIYALHNNHVTAVLLGARRGNGVNAGSRASVWSYYVWYSYWCLGSRFACDHLELV